MKKTLLMLLGVLMALPALACDFSYEYEGQNLTASRSVSSGAETKTENVNYAKETKSTDYVAYFDNSSSNWDEVYVYTWTGGTQHSGSWPGTRLTETIVVNGKTYFVAHIPVADSDTMIIFNNGEGLQTEDLPFIPNSCYNRHGLQGILTFFNFTYEFEGQTLTYSVTSEEDKTVMIKHNDVSGTLIIPEIAKYGDVEYTVTTIGESAFKGCGNLKQVIIPGSVTKISETAFQNCEGLCRVVFPSTIGFDPYENNEGLSASWEYNPENVNPIEDIIKYGCFYDSEEKKVLVFVSLLYTGVFNIPDTVERISSYAFYGCSGLTEVTIPEGVTSIGVGAFSGCTGLTSVTIPEGVTSIDGSAFSGCTGLTSVTIPEGVTSIGGSAFQDCSGLTSIVIPPAVRSIGNKAFFGCSGLKKMAYNNLVINDLSYALDDDKFVFIEYDAQDSRMEDGFIYSRRKTKLYYVPLDFTGSFIIPETVETIGEKAFACCSGLTTVKIPDSVREIEFGAFALCENLASIIIPNNVESIGIAAFQQCPNLKSVNIPTSLTIINDNLFAASGLTSVKIPDTVTSIGECAFALCENLTFVKLSRSLTSIGEEAFVGCYSLSTIEYPATTPVNADSNIFETVVYDNATLYVPQGATKNYDSVNPWKLFYNIEEKDFASVITPAEPVVKVGDKMLEVGSSFVSTGDVEVAMTCETEGAQIYYLLTSVDASESTAETKYILYTEPVKVAATSTLSVYAELNGEKSDVNTYVITIGEDGVDVITGEAETPEYYTLQGIRVVNPEAGQIYIVRQGGRTYKVIMQ